MTYVHFINTDKRGIRNQEEDEIEIKTNTPLINDLEMRDIFKDEDNKEGNGVIDGLITEVL